MTKRLFAALCCAWLFASHAGSSTNYTNNPESINSGGTKASVAASALRATVGQYFVPGAASSTNYANKPGFWHTFVAGPSIQVSPSSIDFGAQPFGLTVLGPAYLVTVTNAGSSDLTVGTPTLSGAQAADFSIASSDCTSVAPGSSCTIGAGFTPSAVGARAAVLNIPSNDVTRMVSLTGNGTAAPQVITFAALLQKVTTDPPFTVSATGGASGNPVTFSSLTTLICTTSPTPGTTVTLTGTPGLCTIQADQAGDTNYAAAAPATQSFAVRKVYGVILEGAQETPVNASAASGSGNAIVDVTVNKITLTLNYTGLSSAVMMAHLHGAAARGSPAGIKINLNPTATQIFEEVTYLEADEADIVAGNWYVNVHTANFPNGEIRGQLDNVGAAPRNLLTVSKAGTGTGTVTSDVGGINCGATCTYNAPQGLVVTLSAAPTGGGTFTGWSGAGCTGTGTCVVTMDAAKGVTATFTAALITYTVTSSGSGVGGTIAPPSQSVAHGTRATFTVTTSPGYTASIAGTCQPEAYGGGATYTTYFITGPCNVAVVFTLNTYTVTASAGANGTITPPSRSVGHGATTTFTVTPDTSYSAAVGGTCGGALVGTTYTTNAITAACTVTATFTLVNPPRLGNISTRMQVLTGSDVMIGGFVIGGSATKRVAIVATGPSLTQFGIANALANPTLSLVRSSDQTTIATSDDWQSAGNAAQLTAAGFAPSNALEAALLVDLAPGAYTAIVQGAGAGTGVAVIGVYEVDHPETPLINISTRGRVLTGNDVMIGGFIVNGSGPQTVAIVATGPSLAQFGIASPLANPTISLVRSSDQVVIATNDDWQTDANASQLQAAGFAPSSPLESGLYVTLPPGAYTVVVQGVASGTGVAVIGVYKVN